MREENYNGLQSQAIQKFLSKDTFRFRGSDVLVFSPVCNEEYTIAEVINKVRQACDFDLLIIDDGSTDSTPHILQELDVEVLRHPVRLGSGIISGLEIGYALGYKYIIKIDGDGQHNPQDIPRLYEHAVKTKADIVIGSRHLATFDANVWSVEGSGMWFCSKLVSFVSRKRITDTTSGFKIWSRKACKTALSAFKEKRLRELSTYHVEELLIASKKKLKVEEISVAMRPREYGETKSYSKKKMFTFPPNLIRSVMRALF